MFTIPMIVVTGPLVILLLHKCGGLSLVHSVILAIITTVLEMLYALVRDDDN